MSRKAYDYANLKTFEKSQVNGLTKKLSSFRFGSLSEETSKQAALDNFRDEVGLSCVGSVYMNGNHYVYHFDKPRKITIQQTLMGKLWLKNFFFKLDGSPRSGQRTEGISARVLSIAKRCKRFEFIGVIGCTNGYGSEVSFIPIYRTYDSRGEYFDYAPVHWGQPVVMEGY